MDKGEGGFSHCGHFADMGGGGVNFLQFCADVFYEQPRQPKITLLNAFANFLQLLAVMLK